MKVIRFKNNIFFLRETETETKIFDPWFYSQCILKTEEVLRRTPVEFSEGRIEWRVEIVIISLQVPPKVYLVQTKGNSCLDTFLIQITE